MTHRWPLMSLLGIPMFVAPSAARAFGSSEHQFLGAAAFTAACEQLTAEQKVRPESLARAERLRIACGATVGPSSSDVAAERLEDRTRVYGQAVSLAGDLLETPAEFFSAAGGRDVLSSRNYISLALVNSSHFLPESVRRWRKVHAESVAEALTAMRTTGAVQISTFEHAFYLHAFADHFLEDSFAAGHMGFNRPASSASASFVFHNRFNAEGRVMFNSRGEVWIGYGDGLLRAAENARNLSLALDANTHSVLAFLRAFLDGQVDADDERTVEVILPVACYAVQSPGYVVPVLRRYLDPDTLALAKVRKEIEAASTDEQRRAIGREPWTGPPDPAVVTNDDALRQPTRAINDRAYKDFGLDASWWYGGQEFGTAGSLQGVVGSLRLRALTNGVRFNLEAGVTYRPTVGFVYGPGLSWQLASSWSGLITHDLQVSAVGHLLCVTCERQVIGSAGYRLNLEASQFILELDIAPAVVDFGGRWTVGWLAGVGVEVLLSASGGGPL